ncbi:MAG: putative Fe-S cluster assembly protein SufT [Gammaproteobacteria bacterium]
MFGPESEPVALKRDVDVTLVPDGFQVSLNADSLVYITQAMGGSFTIYFEGNLFRVGGLDADALGKEPIAPPDLPSDAGDDEFETITWDQMRTVYDPEIPINIVDLGLIYDCRISKMPDGKRYVYVEMTLTAPGCGMGDILVQDVREKIGIIPTVGKVDVELVLDPPWNQTMMSEAAQLEAGLL